MKKRGRHPLRIPRRARKILKIMSLMDASRNLGISVTTVIKWRKILGIDPMHALSRKRAFREDRGRKMAIDLIRLQSVEKVGKKWDMTRQRIHQIVRRYVELRWTWREKCSRKASH